MGGNTVISTLLRYTKIAPVVAALACPVILYPQPVEPVSHSVRIPRLRIRPGVQETDFAGLSAPQRLQIEVGAAGLAIIVWLAFRLQKARVSAEAAERARSRFAANISQELRKPVNGIIGMTQLMLETPLDQMQRDCMETIRGTADALARVVAGIPDDCRIEGGELPERRTRFSVEEVIEEVVAVMAREANEKGLEIGYLPDASVPRTVEGYPGALRQVLTHLLSSAVKFTGQGEIGVRARAESTADGRLELVLVVADTGREVPGEAELHPCRRLMELMGGRIAVESRAERGTAFHFRVPVEEWEMVEERTPVEGMRIAIQGGTRFEREVLSSQLQSLGVEIVAGTGGADALLTDDLPAAYHSGVPVILLTTRERAASRETRTGLRACALLFAPYRRKKLEACLRAVRESAPLLAADFDALMEAVEGESEPARGARILVADDNAVNRLAARRLLQRLGYEVDLVVNGREAVLATEVLRYDLILMDCHMPEMDGFAACEEIRGRDNGPDRPVIVALASGTISERERGQKAGMDDYLIRPLDAYSLMAALKKWVPGRQRERREMQEALARSVEVSRIEV